MGKFGLALRVFWRTLWNREFSERAETLFQPRLAEPEPPAPAEPAPKPQVPTGRSDALNLLAALQREARFLDFLQESLEGYPAEDIKAAVIDIHRDSRQVVERMFGIRPLIDQEEGSSIEVPAGFDAARFTLTGQVSGSAPYRGQLMHPGWQATRCEVPRWTGSPEGSQVLAPAEVEVS